MTITKVNETELYYEEYGSGTPFLLMHGGLGIDHTYFRPALDSLGDIFKLFFYDHRGEGRSGRPLLNTITFEQLADDANVLREILGYDKIGIIGHSAGGCIALNYAIRHPENISYLILIDTFPADDYEEEMMTLLQNKNPTPETIEVLNTPVDPTIEGFRNRLRVLSPLYYYDYNSEMEQIVNKVIDNSILNPETAAKSNILFAKFNVSSQLTKINVPTLILVGKEDFICPPSQAQRMHKSIPNSELILFEKCGHYPFNEVADEFFSVLRDWFKRVHHD